MSSVRALLLTDVVDSTLLVQQVGDAAMARLWSAHDRVARDLLVVWQGREIDKSDGLFLLFDSTAAALGYALAYHRALAALSPPIQARAGLHLGPVLLRENSPADIARGAKPVEVEGLAKPYAARVMGLAQPGQTLLSRPAREALQGTALRVQSHGHWRLKGISEPQEVFEAGEADAPFTPPPDQPKGYRVVRQPGQGDDLWLPVRNVRHSLPAGRDAFVGRHDDLLALARALDGGTRLVSVLGTGGSGKTRLVTQFGWVWLGDFAGGVWFCDLAQARDSDGIARAVAQGLDVPLGRTEPITQLADAIAGRGHCLVILDNFEQVARHAESTLGHWLDHAPQAVFVVTTREVLGIVGERTQALAPLIVADAVQLFCLRAEAARQGFKPGTDEQLAIAQLVQVLDNLPLAIELAAARVRVMAPRVLLQRMNERFKLLWSRGGRQDRQATLRATFDWSWELLHEAERIALAQLSVFAGGFTLESAAQVIDLSALSDAPWLADMVPSLVDKSLVRQITDERFDLLNGVRDYAAEHLRSPGQFVGSGEPARLAAERRHAEYFAALGPSRAVAQACIEVDNLVAACRRSITAADAVLAVQALVGAWAPIRLRGPFRLGLELAEQVAALGPLEGRWQAEWRHVHGYALELCGRVGDAQRVFEQALAAAVAGADRLLQCRALQALTSLMARTGKVDQAEDFGQRALGLVQGLIDPALHCAILNALGQVADASGRSDQSGRCFEQALRLARQHGERRWEGGSAGNLGQFHANQGRFDQARSLYEQALAIGVELGDRQWQANTRCNLGLLHHGQGRWDEAELNLSAALLAAQELGHVRLASVVQCNLGLVAQAQGRPDQALHYYESALALARNLTDKRSEGQFLTYLGRLNGLQGRFDLARAQLYEGQTLLRQALDQLSLGVLLCALAEVERLAGDGAAADAALAQSQTLALALAPVEPGSEFGQALVRARRP